MQPGGKERSATLAIVQAAAALVLLIGLPLVVGAPQTTHEIVIAAIVAVILIAFLLEGVARFVRNRRRPFADSVMPPLKRDDVEHTGIKPRRKP